MGQSPQVNPFQGVGLIQDLGQLPTRGGIHPLIQNGMAQCNPKGATAF